MIRRAFVLALVVAAFAPSAPSHAASRATFRGGILPMPQLRPNAEPGMAVDGGGTVWVSSLVGGEPPPEGAEVPGTAIWRSRDAGRSYEWVTDPNEIVPGAPALPFAGADSDIAAAPERNDSGHYNVYAAALHPAGVTIALSSDGGASWLLDPLAGAAGPSDRPWVAADGACSVYLAYRRFAPWFVHRYDLCDPLGNRAAREPETTVTLTPGGVEGGDVRAGKIVVDASPRSRFRHAVYLPLEVCPIGLVPPGACRTRPYIAVARSLDEGRTFTSHRVAVVRNGAQPIWPVTLATDAVGGVYVAWHDDRDAYLSRSHDAGAHWPRPVRVNGRGSPTAIYPTVAAEGRGVVEVAWYGTTREGNANDQKVMGLPNAKGAASWRVWWARSTNGGRSFDAQPVTGVVHRGIACTSGTGCEIENSRNLFDDFGIVIHPRTHRASIAYTTDQPGGTLETTFSAYATQMP